MMRSRGVVAGLEGRGEVDGQARMPPCALIGPFLCSFSGPGLGHPRGLYTVRSKYLYEAEHYGAATI